MRQLSPLALALVAALTCSCEGPVGSAPSCAAPTAGGYWDPIAAPPGPGGTFGVSNGTEFLLVGHADGCLFCAVHSLNLEDRSWDTVETSVENKTLYGTKFAATGDFVASSELSIAGTGRRETVLGLVVLDRATIAWTVVPLPGDMPPREGSHLHASPEGFVLFGGFSAVEEVDHYEDETAMVSYSDGAVYDPAADTWRLIPPAWPAGEHTFGKNPPHFRFASVPVPGGLFVWGMAPDERSAVSALFSFDEWKWKELDTSVGPQVRRNARLVHHEGYAYLFGGAVPSSGPIYLPNPDLPLDDYYRDLWRYSLKERQWEPITAPGFADLQATEAGWTSKGLLFIGYRCATRALYDPIDDAWTTVESENTPPGAGLVSEVGGDVVVHKVHQNALLTYDGVWLFEP